jgi:hypothetical protein
MQSCDIECWEALSCVDRALMMRHHHCDKIPINIAGGRDLHVRHHFRHCRIIL